MTVLTGDKDFAIRCDCCKTLFDGHDACQPDTTGETADEAQEKASNYDFFCCDPLHICETCQRKIHESKVGVEFHASPKTSINEGESGGIETCFAVQIEAANPIGKWISMRQTAPTIELAREGLLMMCRKSFPDKRLRIVKITEEPVFIDDPLEV